MRSPPKLTSVTRRQRANYGRHYHFPPLSPVSVKQSTVFCMAPVCGLQTSHMPAKTVFWLFLAGAVNKVILLKKKRKKKKGTSITIYMFVSLKNTVRTWRKIGWRISVQRKLRISGTFDWCTYLDCEALWNPIWCKTSRCHWANLAILL